MNTSQLALQVARGLSIGAVSICLAACNSVAAQNDSKSAKKAAAVEMSPKAEAFLERYTRTGETVSCLGVRQISQLRALDDRHFVARVGAGKYYLNLVERGCRNAARSNNRLQYTTSIARLCRNEIITVIDNTSGIVSGSCGLGNFERLELKVDSDDG